MYSYTIRRTVYTVYIVHICIKCKYIYRGPMSNVKGVLPAIIRFLIVECKRGWIKTFFVYATFRETFAFERVRGRKRTKNRKRKCSGNVVNARCNTLKFILPMWYTRTSHRDTEKTKRHVCIYKTKISIFFTNVTLTPPPRFWRWR